MKSSQGARFSSREDVALEKEHNETVLRELVSKDVAMSVQNIEDLIGSQERLRSIFPKILKITTYLLRRLMLDVSRFSVDRVPMDHYAAAQFRLWSLNVRRQIQIRSITFVCVQDSVSSLFELLRYLMIEAPSVAALNVRCFQMFCVAVADLGSHLEKLAKVEPIDYLRVAERLKQIVESSGKVQENSADRQLPRLSDFEFEKVLGAGGFGVVYRALYKPAQVTVSVKLVRESRFGVIENALTDRAVVSVTNHPFVVSYFCIFPICGVSVSVMEYIHGANLHEVVTRSRCLPISYGKLIFTQLALGVSHMHYRGIIHRDIKIENVMVLRGGRVKLLDFDTAKICIAHHPMKLQKSFFQLTSAEFRDRQTAGTLYYMAPELLERRPYGRGCDWWSMGILLFKTIVGRFPFRGKNHDEVKASILERKVQFPRSRTSNANISSVIQFIEKLLEKKPHTRLGSKLYQEIFEDPFLADVNIGNLARPTIFEVPELDVILREVELISDEAFSLLSNGLTDRQDWDRDDPSTPRRTLVRPVDLQGSPDSAPPLFVYASKFFEKIGGRKERSMKHLLQPIRFSCATSDFAIRNTLNLSPSEAETTIVVICVSDAVHAEQLGFSIFAAPSDEGDVFPIVDEIVPKSPASASQLCEGDIITGINAELVINRPIDEVNELLSESLTDKLLSLHVKSSSPFRLFKNRVDFASVLALYEPLVVKTQAARVSSRSRRFFDDSRNCFVRTLLLWTAPPGSNLYNGDIISAVDGMTKCTELPKSGQVELTVIPTSALRKSHLCSDRLLTTYSLATKSVSRRLPSEPYPDISLEDKSSTTPLVESAEEEEFEQAGPWITEEYDDIHTITVVPVLNDGTRNVGDSEMDSEGDSASDDDDDDS